MVNTIHPMLVHFPIALLIVTGIIALIDLLISKYQLKKMVLWNLVFAAIGTVFTVISGFKDANVIPHNETIHEIMELHEKIGIVILVITIILSVWIFLRYSKMKKTENILFVLILWIALAFAGYNGYLGGKMVYDNGAGIKPMQKAFLLEDKDHDHDH
jgi:uncharacterized membrane protein